MKIQTTALITKCSIDKELVSLPNPQSIDLEFSAIDTGGGFKDPILDFSFSIEDIDSPDAEERKAVALTLQDPQNADNQISFSYETEVSHSSRQINGRLKENELSRELIGFVLQLLR